MSAQNSISNVPPSQVGMVVQTFIDAGATRVTALKQPNGDYTVSAQVD